jgi:DNA-binding transcriptional ArsR family regulator
MVKSSETDLDQVFAALSDATRRDVLQRLGEGSSTMSVTTLAEPYEMSLTGFMKHLAVLETAGLIKRSKEGRVVQVELQAQPLQAAGGWISRYEAFWSKRLDALGRYLYHEEQVRPWPPAKPPKSALPSGSSGTTTSTRKKSGGPGPTRKR